MAWRIPGCEKFYGDRGDVSVSSVQDHRFLVSISISSDRGVFSGFPWGQAMNIPVLVVDDEPLRFAESSGGDERRGGTVALAAISQYAMKGAG
jgi:hypothetical protein